MDLKHILSPEIEYSDPEEIEKSFYKIFDEYLNTIEEELSNKKMRSCFLSKQRNFF